MDASVSNNEESGTSGRTYRQVQQFDRNQKDRILNLMQLKTKCLVLDNALRFSFSFHGQASSFFTAISGAVDCLLFAQINEEATACLENGGPIGELLASVLSEAHDRKVPLQSIQVAMQDMESLFHDRGDFVLGSTYLDFIVSTYSAFEMYMAKVYNQLRLIHPSSGHRLKLLKKLITKYNKTPEENKDQILGCIAKVSDFVSGREKIEFVLSKQPKENQRDRTKDLATVRFYSNTRNSIHELGVSTSREDFLHSLEDRKLTHNKGNALFTEDRSDIVRLCGELVDIYADVVAENTEFASDIFLTSPRHRTDL